MAVHEPRPASLPPGDGVAKAAEGPACNAPPVMMMPGHSDGPMAVMAMTLGATGARHDGCAALVHGRAIAASSIEQGARALAAGWSERLPADFLSNPDHPAPRALGDGADRNDPQLRRRGLVARDSLGQGAVDLFGVERPPRTCDRRGCRQGKYGNRRNRAMKAQGHMLLSGSDWSAMSRLERLTISFERGPRGSLGRSSRWEPSAAQRGSGACMSRGQPINAL
jgi:hypothetical protein